MLVAVAGGLHTARGTVQRTIFLCFKSSAVVELGFERVHDGVNGEGAMRTALDNMYEGTLEFIYVGCSVGTCLFGMCRPIDCGVALCVDSSKIEAFVKDFMNLFSLHAIFLFFFFVFVLSCIFFFANATSFVALAA